MKHTIQKAITIKKVQEEWLMEHPEVNLSQIAQVGIDRHKEIFESSLAQKENQGLRERIAKIMETVNHQSEFILKKGLSDEYLRERGVI